MKKEIKKRDEKKRRKKEMKKGDEKRKRLFIMTVSAVPFHKSRHPRP